MSANSLVVFMVSGHNPCGPSLAIPQGARVAMVANGLGCLLLTRHYAKEFSGQLLLQYRALMQYDARWSFVFWEHNKHASHVSTFSTQD